MFCGNALTLATGASPRVPVSRPAPTTMLIKGGEGVAQTVAAVSADSTAVASTSAVTSGISTTK